MKAVIVAAGQSSRLWKRTSKTPKTLLPFGRGTILSTIIGNLRGCGIEDFVVVVGWKSGHIKDYVAAQDGFGDRVKLVDNADWMRGNGVSVLAAREAVGGEPFMLSMSDHIVSPAAMQRVATWDSGKNLLLVDDRVDSGLRDIELLAVAGMDGALVEIAHLCRGRQCRELAHAIGQGRLEADVGAGVGDAPGEVRAVEQHGVAVGDGAARLDQVVDDALVLLRERFLVGDLWKPWHVAVLSVACGRCTYR